MIEIPSDAATELLLVEDNPADAELTLRTLRKQGLVNHIHLVNDGAEAIDFLFCTGAYASRTNRHALRLVLLDLKLPKVDGLEVLRHIKSHPDTRELPVVVMTSSQEECDMVESYRLGVNSYIVKPVDFGQFTDAVRMLGFYWLLLNKTPLL